MKGFIQPKATTRFCVAFVVSLLLSLFCFSQVNAQLATIDGNIIPKDELKDSNIDYTSITIQLVNSKGYVKEKVEVDPHGFYLLPLYEQGDKSSYTLKAISSNKILSIEPESLNIKDGEIKTYNFYIMGFKINSQIKTQVLGSNKLLDGSSGIQVSLKSMDNKIEKKTITKQDGSFSFDQVVPGTYELIASHSEIIFSTSNTIVEVLKDGSLKLEKPLTIAGFNVKGKVVLSTTSGNEQSELAMAGVEVYLQPPVSLDEKEVKKIYCKDIPKDKTKGICVTTTDNTGSFVFKGIPAFDGEYTVKAIYQKFNINPKEINFKVTNNNVVLKNVFRVTGFSLKGQVSTVEGPLSGVKLIIINKKNRFTTIKQTDERGQYTLDDLNGSETFEIQVEADEYTFQPKTIVTNPSKTEIDTITPSHAKVCGKLLREKGIIEKRVVILKVGDTKLTVTTDNDFCFNVPITNEKQTARIEVLREYDNQVKYLPQTFTFDNQPIHTLKLAQKFSKVTGKVNAKTHLDQTIISLLDKEGNKVQTKTLNKNGEFEFESLLPTQYVVSIEQPSLCWKEKDIEIDLAENDQQVQFQQTGYLITILSSHDNIQLTYSLRGNSNNQKEESYTVKKGKNLLCVAPVPGEYELKIINSCFKFEEGTEYIYNTASPKVVELDVVGYLIYGKLRVPDNFNEYTIVNIANLDKNSVGSPSLTLKTQDQVSIIQTTREVLANNKTVLSYKYFTPSALKTTLEIKPQSDALLFFPQKRVVEITSNIIESGKCIDEVPAFEGREGKYINGDVGDAIQGVRISVNNDERETFTDKSGQFKIGPLYEDNKIELKAEKDGYSFEYIGNNKFKAYKLASITVVTNLKDSLVSLISSKYKNNTIINESGRITFYNLVPDRYYIKAMLKEYEFKPSSQYITLGEGKDETVVLEHKKVGFSVFGNVKSIGSEPESNVVVQAIAKEQGEYEETTTDQNGQFRIRGLKPNTNYHIVLGTHNTNIERFSPKQIVIEQTSNDDSLDNNFIVFRQSILQFTGEVGNIVNQTEEITIDLMTATNNKQFRVIDSQKLPITGFFSFVTPSDKYLKEENTRFYIRLTSSGKQGKLNSNTYFITSSKNIMDSLSAHEQKTKVASLGSDIEITTTSPTRYHLIINSFSTQVKDSETHTSVKQEKMDQKPLYALVIVIISIVAWLYRVPIQRKLF
ncbi:hypothetical protein ABK040_010062 [Willaertia magna]